MSADGRAGGSAWLRCNALSHERQALAGSPNAAQVLLFSFKNFILGSHGEGKILRGARFPG